MRYAVYILASNLHGTLYVTNDLARRLGEHRSGIGSGFVRKYSVNRLVHVELFDEPGLAIAREKHWNRD
jgi:putative endonuclease